MSQEPVLVVLTNWKREQNMSRIIEAWKGQSHPTYVVVVDNSPFEPAQYQEDFDNEPRTLDKEFYPEYNLDKASDVWRIVNNLGPVCRFAPALMLAHKYEYCVFADDDLIPGCRAVENCMRVAKEHPDFATIGHAARNFQSQTTAKKLNTDVWPKPTYKYAYGNVPRGPQPVKVDMTLRCHFTRTIHSHLAMDLAYAIRHKNKTEEADRLCSIHDDMLLCLWGRAAEPQPCYILSLRRDWGEGRDGDLIAEDLDRGDDTALWRRPGHLSERQRMLELCVAAGWRSVR